MNRYYSTHEAARLLGVSLPTVVNWIKARRLRCHRTPGGHRRIAREDLAAFMLRHGIPLADELSDAAPDRRKVLVVGDLGPAREGLARQLSQGGWSAEVTSPGFAAGATLARYQPHVVVLLATQPDGGETLAALRADREAGATPVVAIGHADWKAGLLRAGATSTLARPVGGEALAAAVDAAVGRIGEAPGQPEPTAAATEETGPARRRAAPKRKAR